MGAGPLLLLALTKGKFLLLGLTKMGTLLTMLASLGVYLGLDRRGGAGAVGGFVLLPNRRAPAARAPGGCARRVRGGGAAGVVGVPPIPHPAPPPARKGPSRPPARPAW